MSLVLEPGMARGDLTNHEWTVLAANFQATLDLVETLDWLRAVPDNQDPQDRT
jgi:hypothetical protein